MYCTVLVLMQSLVKKMIAEVGADSEFSEIGIVAYRKQTNAGSYCTQRLPVWQPGLSCSGCLDSNYGI